MGGLILLFTPQVPVFSREEERKFPLFNIFSGDSDYDNCYNRNSGGDERSLNSSKLVLPFSDAKTGWQFLKSTTLAFSR